MHRTSPGNTFTYQKIHKSKIIKGYLHVALSKLKHPQIPIRPNKAHGISYLILVSILQDFIYITSFHSLTYLKSNLLFNQIGT